jgi:hypothetical protein
LLGGETGEPSGTAGTRDNDRLIQTTFDISERQYKALKLRVAVSDNPAEKDMSAVVRAALDACLAKQE